MNEDKAKYDIRRLSKDIRSCSEELGTLKRTMRQSKYQPTWQEYRQKDSLKQVATSLCCLRANHRGKLHLKDPIKNLELVQQIEEDYILAKQEAA